MELNPVAGLVLLSKATTISDDKPSLADLDSDSDEEDDQGTVVVNHIKIVFWPTQKTKYCFTCCHGDNWDSNTLERFYINDQALFNN